LKFKLPSELKKEQRNKRQRNTRKQEGKEIRIDDRAFFVVIFFVLWDASYMRHSLHPRGVLRDRNVEEQAIRIYTTEHIHAATLTLC